MPFCPARSARHWRRCGPLPLRAWASPSPARRSIFAPFRRVRRGRDRRWRRRRALRPRPGAQRPFERAALVQQPGGLAGLEVDRVVDLEDRGRLAPHRPRSPRRSRPAIWPRPPRSRAAAARVAGGPSIRRAAARAEAGARIGGTPGTASFRGNLPQIARGPPCARGLARAARVLECAKRSWEDIMTPELGANLAGLLGPQGWIPKARSPAGPAPAGMKPRAAAGIARPANAEAVAAGAEAVQRGGAEDRGGGRPHRPRHATDSAADEDRPVAGRMTAIREIDPVGRTMIVEAGATIQAVQEAARRWGCSIRSTGARGSATVGGSPPMPEATASSAGA